MLSSVETGAPLILFHHCSIDNYRTVAAVRKLTEVKVYSPTAAHRDAFAEKMTGELKIPVHAALSAEEALTDADILITATNARTSVFDGNCLKEGTHTTSNAIGLKAFERLKDSGRAQEL